MLSTFQRRTKINMMHNSGYLVTLRHIHYGAGMPHIYISHLEFNHCFHKNFWPLCLYNNPKKMTQSLGPLGGVGNVLNLRAMPFADEHL